MTPDTEPAPSPPPRRPRWEAISAMTAVAGLIAGLVFYGVQVSEANQTARQTRQATQLQLYTQMQSLVNGPAFAPGKVETMNRRLTQAHQQQLDTEANNMEYLAYLFNLGYITLPRAKQLWGPAMSCFYKTATPYLPAIKKELPELARFVGSHPHC
jgi:hypothetical protein